jgi:hypothetical protein
MAFKRVARSCLVLLLGLSIGPLELRTQQPATIINGAETPDQVPEVIAYRTLFLSLTVRPTLTPRP